ncbi:hypothetical protein [Microtetraspora malaysiensis]
MVSVNEGLFVCLRGGTQGDLSPEALAEIAQIAMDAETGAAADAG